MNNKFRSILLASTTLFLLSGCGVAHITTKEQANDLQSYNQVYINTVDIHSQEPNAATNAKLQNKMVEWESFARNQLENHVQKSNYSLIQSEDQITDNTLIVNLDIDLVYGSRAARYFGGFGAGKGSVDSLLTASDQKTNNVKFKAVAESDLAVGFFGGDMQGVLKDNIKELVQQYPAKQR